MGPKDVGVRNRHIAHDCNGPNIGKVSKNGEEELGGGENVDAVVTTSALLMMRLKRELQSTRGSVVNYHVVGCCGLEGWGWRREGCHKC